MENTLLNKLEEFKQLGNYAVQLFFGGETGCDDLDVPIMERDLICIASPVGYLGSMRVLYKGTVKSFLDFDLKNNEPVQIPNPPSREDYKESGFYFWGTESSVEISETNGYVFCSKWSEGNPK